MMLLRSKAPPDDEPLLHLRKVQLRLQEEVEISSGELLMDGL